MSARQRTRALDRACEYWRTAGFPYPELAPPEVEREFNKLCRSPVGEQQARGGRIGSSTVGLRLVNAYHPQMWHARSHRHLRSVVEYFHDDEHLRRMLSRAPRFWPNRRCWSAQSMRSLLRMYAGGRVANFRPVVARHVVARFSREGDTVLDFSSGYGGRLAACISLGRRYIGIDPAVRQIEGLARMAEDLSQFTAVSTTLHHGCAEDVLPEQSAGGVDLVFSSPPFFNLEIYSDEPNQSSSRYPTYERWRSYFLEAVIRGSRRVLKRRGVFAIHAPPAHSHRLGADVAELASRYFFHTTTLKVSMAARPLHRANDAKSARFESIMVFRKR